MKNEQKENLYSKTVNLPETAFPMKADLSKREPLQIKKWQEINILSLMNQKKSEKSYILHDGPPYANGNFHVGHALNKILKDIIIKSKNLSGYRTELVPGWDCHGLPIEVQVLKNLDKKASSTSPAELRQKCRDYANEFVNKQGEDLTRFLCFWEKDKKYLTMSKDFESKIIGVFGELFVKGYIYKGKKPVYWCTSLATAHAEAEIEYAPHVSPSVYVKFPIVGEKDSYCLIWTTTPWTLPANLAICFNENIRYSYYKTISNDKLILADELAGKVEEATGIRIEKIKDITKDEIKNLKFNHPFIDRISIPLFGDHVTLEAGTGCVHTAPGHGMDDYKVGLKAGLDPLSPVDDRGRYTDEFLPMKGIQIFEANPKIIELLKEKNLLLYHTDFSHSYPHSWRSKKPLIFRATPQWFFSIDGQDLRENSLKEIDKVNWVPEWGITRIRSMVESRPDWCLSRQRNWGVPIPAFKCKTCQNTIMTKETISHFIKLVEKEGIEIWYNLPAEELIPPNTQCPNCKGIEFEKENDILDVWFDSGVSNFAVFGDSKDKPPADLYLEGTDQHRGWFQSSLWPSMALRGFPPYKSVLTHGYVLDEKGHAMSKSLGNVINPTTDIINVYGADILRLWVSSQDFRDDVKIGSESIKVVSDQYRKIRNTFRYLLGNLNGHNDSMNLSYDELEDIDKYYLHQLAILNGEIQASYESFQFHQIYQKVLRFCTVELSQDYFEIIRDRLYCNTKDSKSRRSTCTVLSHILENLSILLSPILSFTCEEVWENYKKDNSVFLENFRNLKKFQNSEIEKKISPLFQIKTLVQKALEQARQKGSIGKSLGAIVYIDSIEKLPFSTEEMEFFLVVSQVEFGKAIVNSISSIQSESYNIEIVLPLETECPRCWKHTKEKSENGLCKRCEQAIK